jgi:hypothetical protein
MAEKRPVILGDRAPQPVNPWGIQSEAVVQPRKADECPQVMSQQYSVACGPKIRKVM